MQTFILRRQSGPAFSLIFGTVPNGTPSFLLSFLLKKRIFRT